MLLWCCQDWFFNVLERYQEEVDEEMREEETRAPPRSPIEKVQRMGRIGGRIMQNLIRPKAAPLRKPSSDEEDETELAEEPEELPKPRRSLHNFQAPRDLGSDPFAAEIRRVLVTHDLDFQAPGLPQGDVDDIPTEASDQSITSCPTSCFRPPSRLSNVPLSEAGLYAFQKICL
eukprot:g9155.t1